jgi:hypothetical protein
MFFLNLNLGEFLALLGSLSGLVAALYLLDRSRRKKVVSTLRFWTGAPQADEQRKRKHIREPWSLILQLLSLLFLLLALAQLQWGSRERAGRSHVLVLDTSSSMAQRTAGTGGSLMDRAKTEARRFVASVPSRDRIMLIRADSLATPATSLTENHQQVLDAIGSSAASYSALNLASALELAGHAARWSGLNEGEIVFVGGTRVSGRDDEFASVPHLRVIPVDAESGNIGIRQLGARRDETGEGLWKASVAVRNYADTPQRVTLQLSFARTKFAPRELLLQANEERHQDFKFRTDGAGTLTALLLPEDALALDNRADLQLPANGRLRFAVYSDRPGQWQPFLEADRRIRPTYFAPRDWNNAVMADAVLLDRFAPPAAPRVPSLWVMPPQAGSPVPLKTVSGETVLNRWNAETELGAGLRSKEIRLSSAEVFAPVASDIGIAYADRGALVVARPATANQPRLAEIGFDPLSEGVRYDVSTPLLFADLLRWLEPESFRITELTATTVGTAAIPLEANEAAEHFRVVDASGFALPFTVKKEGLEFYAAKPGLVRVISANRERVLALTLPGIGEFRWKPPAAAIHSGLSGSQFAPAAVDLWKWLAVAGALGLAIEWFLFGRRSARLRSAVVRSEKPRPEEELIHQ